MKAYCYTDRISLDSLHLVTRPDPEPGPGDIVLRMQAAAFNFRDLALLTADYHIQATPPLVPLSDGAGKVVAVGPSVSRFKVGDLACPLYLPDWIEGPVRPRHGRRRLGGPTDGVLVEYLCLSEDEAVRMPAWLTPHEASAFPVTGVTAWRALFETSSLKPGHCVFVRGTGGLAMAVLQLARAGGARVLIGTRDPSHASTLEDLGAEAVIPTGNDPGWPQRVLGLTQERGVDIAFETLGGDSLNQTLSILRVGGQIHLTGFVTASTAGVNTFDAIRRAASIHASTAGNRADFEALIRTVEAHRIRPVIDRIYPLAQLKSAFELMGERGRLGKVVLDLTWG